MTSAEDSDQKSRTALRGAPSDEEPNFKRRIFDSAIEAEFETGKREETVEEAQRSVAKRLARATLGFIVIGIGIALLPLPGPGWALIIIGLTMLPFAWAERTVRIIRRKVPGIPEDGRIPNSTWVILGFTMITFSTLSILFGDDMTGWIRSVGNPDRLLG